MVEETAVGAGTVVCIILGGVSVLLLCVILYVMLRPILGPENVVIKGLQDSMNGVFQKVGQIFGMTEAEVKDLIKEESKAANQL